MVVTTRRDWKFVNIKILRLVMRKPDMLTALHAYPDLEQSHMARDERVTT